jgi:hypothetical protein
MLSAPQLFTLSLSNGERCHEENALRQAQGEELG